LFKFTSVEEINIKYTLSVILIKLALYIVNNSLFIKNVFEYLLQCCAVSFIENINAELLSMNIEEFEQYMNGTLVSDTWDSALIICEVNIKMLVLCESLVTCVYMQGLTNFNKEK